MFEWQVTVAKLLMESCKEYAEVLEMKTKGQETMWILHCYLREPKSNDKQLEPSPNTDIFERTFLSECDIV